MVGKESKTVALTVASGLIVFGFQQAAQSNLLTGGVGVIVGLAVFYGYQVAEEQSHAKQYNDVVEAIGEDTLEELSKWSADEVKDLPSRLSELTDQDSDS